MHCVVLHCCVLAILCICIVVCLHCCVFAILCVCIVLCAVRDIEGYLMPGATSPVSDSESQSPHSEVDTSQVTTKLSQSTNFKVDTSRVTTKLGIKEIYFCQVRCQSARIQ